MKLLTRQMIILSIAGFMSVFLMLWYFSTGAYQVEIQKPISRITHSFNQIPATMNFVVEKGEFLNLKDNFPKTSHIKYRISDECKEGEGYYCIFITKSTNDEIKIGRKRTIWIKSREENIKRYIEELTRVLYEQEERNKNIETSKWSENYKFSFTLLNTDATNHLISWNFEEVLEKVLIKEFINKIKRVYPNLNVDSQIINYGKLPAVPKKINSEWIIQKEEMKFLLNRNNWKLESMDQNNDESLHFLYFVPPLKYSPLRILDQDKLNFAPLNAYIIPRWGGVTLFNYAKNETLLIESDSKEMQEFVKIFISQIRKLLGITVFPRFDNFLIEKSGYGISDWELDKLIRRKGNEYLLKSKESLIALSKIVATQENLMVNAEVKKYVELSVDNIKKAELLIAKSNSREYSYEKIYNFARLGYVYSERAFYHPSMNSLMYFSLTQKLAVYVPFMSPFITFFLRVFIKEIKQILYQRRTNKKQKSS